MTDDEVKPVTVCPNGKHTAQDTVDVDDVARVYANKMNSIPEAANSTLWQNKPTGIDMVNHPQHYKTGKIECIECISAVVSMYDGEQAYDVGQVVKYLYRAPTKQNFMQDLKKAQWYLNRLIKIASKTNK